MTQSQPGQLFILTGPSGVGKSTIGARLRERIPALESIVTYTTRDPRPNEKNGVHYHFIDAQTFMAMAHHGEFLEWAQVYNHYYGNSRQSVLDKTNGGKSVLLVIDVQGASTIKKQLPGQAHVIFIQPDKMTNLKKHLQNRKAADPRDLSVRLKKAEEEINQARQFDFVVVNREGHIDETVQAVAKIIQNVLKAKA